MVFAFDSGQVSAFLTGPLLTAELLSQRSLERPSLPRNVLQGAEKPLEAAECIGDVAMLGDTVTLGNMVTSEDTVTIENIDVGNMVTLGDTVTLHSPLSASVRASQEGRTLSQVKMEINWEERLGLQEDTPG